MVILLATVAAAVVASTLLASAIGHVRHPGRLVDALVRHAVVPPRPAGAVAAAVVCAEAALGVGVALSPWWTPWPLVGAAALFAGYAAYTEHLRRTRHDAPPCGCSGAEVAVTGWVVGRAAALSALALLALALGVPDTAPPAAETVVAMCAAAAFAVLLWHLPAAMAVPAGVTPTRGGGAPSSSDTTPAPAGRAVADPAPVGRER